MTERERVLILCGGLQSGGTTLVSYCFLQRTDTDGVLDADNDLLPALDLRLARPIAWYKTTVCCFRLSEIARHYRDAGWNVRTLLVVRDLRAVWASLRTKSYGRNGITAEDPPLRLRVRRFVEDWREAQATRTVLLHYEGFVSDPATTLRQACVQLALPWDEAMLTWPKAAEQIADCRNGNESFWMTCGANLTSSIAQFRGKQTPLRIPSEDQRWLETEFRDYHRANGYPESISAVEDFDTASESISCEPSFEVTRRYKWETAQKPFRWLLAQLGQRNTTLIERRSWKRAA
jgi:hypothetical protein